MPTNPTPTDQPEMRERLYAMVTDAEGWELPEPKAMFSEATVLTFATTIAAEARLEERERAAKMARKHEAALRVTRGWLITCSESAQARRDLKTLDEALAFRSSTGEG